MKQVFIDKISIINASRDIAARESGGFVFLVDEKSINELPPMKIEFEAKWTEEENGEMMPLNFYPRMAVQELKKFNGLLTKITVEEIKHGK